MITSAYAYPRTVSREEWLAARKELLAKEKELTRVRDEVNAKRRRLPMVRTERSIGLIERDVSQPKLK